MGPINAHAGPILGPDEQEIPLCWPHFGYTVDSLSRSHWPHFGADIQYLAISSSENVNKGDENVIRASFRACLQPGGGGAHAWRL